MLPKGAEMCHLANQCNHSFKGKTRNARLVKPGSMQLEQRVLIQPALAPREHLITNDAILRAMVGTQFLHNAQK